MRDFLNVNMHYYTLRKGLEEIENVRELNATRMLQLDNKEEILLQERLKMYAAIPRKLSQNCTRQFEKKIGDMINTLFLTDCSCRTYFCCFPLALANISPRSLLPVFQIL